MGLAVQNNNPGNLRDPSTGGFQKFNSPQEGYAALLNDLQAKQTGTTTTGLGPSSSLIDFASKYAPGSDNNNPGEYAANLANKMGVRPDSQLKDLDLGKWASAVANNEDDESTFGKQTGVNSLIQGGETQAPDQTGLVQPSTSGDQLDQQIQSILSKKSQPTSLGDTIGNGIKAVGDFIAPSVGDAYHLIKGDNQKTGLQLAGDLGSTALSAATLIPGVDAIAAPAKAALLGAKGVEAGVEGANLAAKAAPSIGNAIAKNGALGAAFGATGALGAGETDPTKIAESTALGAGTGGILGAAGSFLGSKVGNVAEASAEGRLTSQKDRLKTLTRTFDLNSRADTNPIKTLTDNLNEKNKPLISLLKVKDGKVDASELSNPQDTGAVDNLIESHSQQASELVKSLQGSVPIKDAEAKVLQQVASNPAIRDTGGVSKAQAEVKRIFADYQNSFGDELPYTAIDGIRAGMNRVYDPAERDVARTVGDTMRDYLYKGGSANKALKAAMQNEGELIRARNFVEKLQGTTVPGGQLGKYFHELAGTAVGTAVGNFFGPLGSIAGGVSGGAVAHSLENASQGRYFAPVSAKAAGALQNAAKGLPGKVAQGAAKAGLLRTAGSLVN